MKSSTILFFLYLSIISAYLTVAGDSPPRYTPLESITIDCGSSGDNIALDGRVWTGDNTPKLSLVESKNNRSVSLKAPNTLAQVPFSTARVSRSEFAYVIPLTPGQKFVRLYFFPTSYPSFDDSKAFFSVITGDFTLLKNFSAILHAQGKGTLIKEFCVNVDGGQEGLNLRFIPSPDISDSYSFVNGIEIVSMPTNLYYRPADDEGIVFIGQRQGSLYPMGNNTAIELMNRINVGGKQISPVEDTGMFRFWSADDDYLTEAAAAVLPVNISIGLNYSDDKHLFSAPDVVYRTARTMGTNRTVNEHYNLTWEFPVDSGFSYFVRLHFCEFQIEILRQGDRVFEIFIAGLTAETQMDVINWSGGRGVPTYKDYVVAIGFKGNEKKQNLSIALHPAPRWKTHYSDAILNGVEIFKLSNNGNLAGINPDPEPTSPTVIVPRSSQQGKHGNNKTTIIGVVVGVSGFVILSILCFFIVKHRMRIKSIGSASRGQLSNSNKSSNGSNLPSDICRFFSIAEIKAATNNFDSVFIIGVGGFGSVYKGFIDGGATPVAIKRLDPESQQGALEFRTEIEMLSQLRYIHLVSLIGYCNDDNEMILVYDFMAHGTLRDHLYNTENPRLPWRQRLKICIGAARGLQYLHSGAKHIIIHRDVKTTNILLDEKWVAKVSDFGLSKVGPTNMSKAYVSTLVKGSFGYLDPEYFRRQQLTEKSDVYSFGVVLCEVLCARPPVNRLAEKSHVNLAMCAQNSYRNGTLYQIVDPFLKGMIAPECLKKYAEVAISCLHDEGIKRPSMNDVVWGLEFALQLQESAEKEIELGWDGNEIDADESCEGFSCFSIAPSDEHISVTKDSEVMISGTVFSEIKNPQGR
ncbi:FERONIA [Hibiscus trionum]|uniref:FERONIA n=1 Tax=Hibiscus trionum TaxID=183268 RepID=A0A9W7LL58_HIBTR|nr:FERONIA [Hibiscus trionum]